ncbi:hypothetical protein N7486_008559 [Penicillium sp. IBT 16267x]|nr:hypothetical protein N7486_008559 [Penicillium sp. IBT 16267x]
MIGANLRDITIWKWDELTDDSSLSQEHEEPKGKEHRLQGGAKEDHRDGFSKLNDRRVDGANVVNERQGDAEGERVEEGMKREEKKRKKRKKNRKMKKTNNNRKPR